MELLQEYDWKCNFKDGNTFIKNESTFKNSAMFQIIDNTFTNPLLDSSDEENPEEIPNSIKSIARKSNRITTNITTSIQHEKSRKPRIYIPGFVILPPFPRSSILTPEEHNMCIKVLQSLNNNNISFPNFKTNDFEMQRYNNLIPKINEERKEFFEHTKNIWLTRNCVRYLNILPENELLINQIIKKNSEAYKKYPRFYQMASMFPLVYNGELPIEISYLKDLSEVELQVPNIKIPRLDKKYVLGKVDDKYFNPENQSSFSQLRQEIVSTDYNCEKLALEHKASIVISSNGLKILANNPKPFTQTWSLPILVKQYTLKDDRGAPIIHNVVYIDKALPLNHMCNHEKNMRCFKYLLKSSLLQQTTNENNQNIKQIEKTDRNKSISKQEKIENVSCIQNNEMSINTDSSDDENLIVDFPDRDNKIDETDTPNANASIDKTSENKDNIQMHVEKSVSSVSYKLWRIGQNKDKNHLSKNLEEDIKVLVRCKVDGCEIDKNDKKQILNIVPKLEYQTEFGAEISTASESAQNWSLLQFRPNSMLLRARILPYKKEVLMFEKLTLSTISKEISQHKTWKPENSIGTYFSIFSRLSKLAPGEYLLRHEPKHHAFAVLYSGISTKCENGLDLWEYYQTTIVDPLTNQKAPWIPLDSNILTPNLAHHNLMPCMFPPGKCKLFKTKEKKVISKVTKVKKGKRKKGKKKK